MFFKQIKKNGDNFSYIIADDVTREAAIVDPSYNAETIIQIAKREELNPKYIINTHGHGDHTAGSEDIKKAFNAKIAAHKTARTKDVSVADGDTLKLGKITIKVIHTPGHTPDGICLLTDGKLLTGDTLFIGECGRTDMPGASPEAMFDSLLNKLSKLDDKIEVYPGHDYGPKPSSTIGEEKKTNYTLKKRTLKEFLAFISAP